MPVPKASILERVDCSMIFCLPPTQTLSSEFIIKSDCSDFGSMRRISFLAHPSQCPLCQHLVFQLSIARYSLITSSCIFYMYQTLETPRIEADILHCCSIYQTTFFHFCWFLWLLLKKEIIKLVKNRGFLLHSVHHWNHC